MDFLASIYSSVFDYIGIILVDYVTWVPGWFAGALLMIIVMTIVKYVSEYVCYLFGKEFRITIGWFIILVLVLSFPAGKVSKDQLDQSYEAKYKTVK